MTALIKSGAATDVRTFQTLAALGPVADLSPAAPAEDPRIAQLSAENEALRAEIAVARRDAEAAVAKAKEDGQRAGMLAAVRDDEKRIEALSGGIAAAVERFEARIAELDGLAALVARTALAKLFDKPELHGAIVPDMAARQIRSLRRDSVMTVQVSAADFPDEAALAAFSGAAGVGSASVLASSELAAGECRIDLQLGHVDVGPRAQWPALAAVLDELAAGEPAA